MASARGGPVSKDSTTTAPAAIEVDYAEAVRRFPKLLQLTGGDPALLPPKARKVLGDAALSPEAQRAMRKQDELEARRDERARKERVEEISRLLPTPEQLALPIPGRRISEKALRFFGDERLEEASRRAMTEEERRNVAEHPKLVKMLGEPSLVAKRKVLSRLGSEMRLGQRKAQRKAEQAEQARRANLQRKRLEETLRALPTEEQLQVPRNAQTRPISEKALRFFGDEQLNQRACRVVTPEMRKNVCPKTLRFFGAADLLTDKERQILGDIDNAPMPQDDNPACVDLQQQQSSWLGSILKTLRL